MAATLEIRELPKSLSLRVAEPKPIGRILFGIAIGVVVTLFFIKAMPLKIFVGGFCVFSMIRSFIPGLRGTDVELLVTNL